jgi:hypothetical protein
MKLVVTILVAAFMVAAGMTFAFAECAGHNKAQLVQSTDPQSITDKQATNGAPAVTSDKVAQNQKLTETKDRVKK